MFSLIVVLISILLVGLLAAACIYYGGSAFSNAGDSATVSKVINESTQLTSALKLYSVNTGGFPTGTQAEIEQQLIDAGYLTGMPNSVPWTLVNDYVVTNDVPDALCLAINERHNLDHIPACSAPESNVSGVCCSE